MEEEEEERKEKGGKDTSPQAFLGKSAILDISKKWLIFGAGGGRKEGRRKAENTQVLQHFD